MRDAAQVTGIVLKTMPVGEYDKVLTVLTKERGKISGFVRGARKQNNRLMAASDLFVFGRFMLYEGRSSYTIADIEVLDYFASLHRDPQLACLGMYFLELADYYTRENNDEYEFMVLLFRALQQLTAKDPDTAFIRAVYECKAMIVSGEFPGVPNVMRVSDATMAAVQFLQGCQAKDAFKFRLEKEALSELIEVASADLKKIVHHQFKSLAFLDDFAVENQK